MNQIIAIAEEGGFVRWRREERGCCGDHFQGLFGSGVNETWLGECTDDFEV